MSDLSFNQTDDELFITAGDTVVAEYHATSTVDAVNTPKPYFHPLRTLAGVEFTDFAPDDHPWHNGLQFAFPRVGDHNLWGGGTYFGPDEGYRVVDDQGTIRHDNWGTLDQVGDSGSFTEQLSWLGHNDELLLTENRRVVLSLRSSESTPAWVLDFSTTLTNVTDAPLALETPAQRGRVDGGYGGLFLRLGHNMRADRLVGDHGEVIESGAESRTLVIQAHTDAGVAVTLGLSFLPGATGGAQKWLYRFPPEPDFAAVGWAGAYDAGFELAAAGTVSFTCRLAAFDGTVNPRARSSPALARI